MNSSKFKISIINDEVDSNLNNTISFISDNNLKYIEIRTVNNKNVASLKLNEARLIRKLLDKNEIRVSCISSPLFKWYPGNSKETQDQSSSYSFPERLSSSEKINYVNHVVELAAILGAPYIRIFSLFRDPISVTIDEFWTLEEDIYNHAFKKASDYGIKLIVENGFYMHLHSTSQLSRWSNLYSSKPFTLLFDPANAAFIGEKISALNLNSIKNAVSYIHVKDYDPVKKQIVPFGLGSLPWRDILNNIEVGTNFSGFLSLEFDGKYSKDVITDCIRRLRSITSDK